MENGQKKYSWSCYGGKFSAQMVGEQFEAIMKGEEVMDASATAMFDGFEETTEE